MHTGLAIQSMRSGTYVHPGEQLTCQGCHERRQGPVRSERTSAGHARAPSKITPDVDGSNPFNYVRLVQQVLDRQCVECHQAKGALDLAGVVEGPYGWTRSYNNLAPKYGFYFHVTNGAILTGVHGGARTIPGQFGARAAGLLPYLSEAHYGVKLSAEDLAPDHALARLQLRVLRRVRKHRGAVAGPAGATVARLNADIAAFQTARGFHECGHFPRQSDRGRETSVDGTAVGRSVATA